MAPGIDGRILINDGAAPVGTQAQVEITEAYADDLVGHIVSGSGDAIQTAAFQAAIPVS
jgi:hypothetical protein